MIYLIGRNRGIAIGRTLSFRRLATSDYDFDHPLITALFKRIELSSALPAGELGYFSGGLAIAQRLLDEGVPRRSIVFVARPPECPETADLLRRTRTIDIWPVVDLGVIVARCVLRAFAAKKDWAARSRTSVFVTDARHADAAPGVLGHSDFDVISLRSERDMSTRRTRWRSEIVQAARATSGLPLRGRVRELRLGFDIAGLPHMLDRLLSSGVEEIVIGDTAGHRPRRLVELCIERGIRPIVTQHGRATNPCRYVPPAHVVFVARTEDEGSRLRRLMERPEAIEWAVVQPIAQNERRTGMGVLVCPSLVGSKERRAALKADVDRLRSIHGKVGIRFHPDEKFARMKALWLRVHYTSSLSRLEELDPNEWGVAHVPFRSSVVDELEAAGFTMESEPPG